ncbi:unnamed protein product [Closterium sp. NIES-65]|nr:unnamed protein product [Closterium sp. NIES-65]
MMLLGPSLYGDSGAAGVRASRVREERRMREERLLQAQVRSRRIGMGRFSLLRRLKTCCRLKLSNPGAMQAPSQTSRNDVRIVAAPGLQIVLTGHWITNNCFSRSFPPSLIHITTNQPTNQVNSTLASLERNADVASLTQQQTTCSCYRVRNDYCCYQYMCKCSPMCWNGYQPISLGEPKCAPATEHAPPQPGQPPVLTPVSCAEQHTFRSALYSCFPETSEGGLGVRSTGEGGGGSGGGGEGGERGGGRGGEGWLGSRSGVDWRFGQTMLQTFSQSEGNIAHFSRKWGGVGAPAGGCGAGLLLYCNPLQHFPNLPLSSHPLPFIPTAEKVFTLLLANNFTASAALQSTVNRLMLPRSPQFIERIRTIGADSMFARVMQAMIEFAVTPLLASRVHNSPELLAHKTLGDLPMAFGLVEFESAWNAATESRPLCFESLLLPGIFKGMVFPSHPDQGTYLERHLRIKLGLKPPEKMVWGADGARGWRPRVLYITRLGAELKGRRCFVPESHEALLRLMNDLDFQVTMVEMGHLTFRQQFEAIQSADIIISLHSASLMNAPLFARRNVVVIEIMPYKVAHELYYSLMLNSGMPYILKMCRKGDEQEGDAEFKDLNHFDCMHKHAACKEHHVHHRRVKLTNRDLQDLKTMLMVAKGVTGASLGAFGREIQPKELPRWAEEKFKDVCVARDVDWSGPRNDFLRVPKPGKADEDFICVFSRDDLDDA